MSTIRLTGCRPEPLASYLKSLGVFRLVAEQKDPNAKAWWEGNLFRLWSLLDEEALQWFFLRDYQPTPLLGPWGARSGFYPGASEKAARSALTAIAKSDNKRLGMFRREIEGVNALLKRHGWDQKPKDDKEKLRLMQACRSELNDDVLGWFDAVYALSGETRDPRKGRAFAPLLGSGGNEGSGSYFSNFAQRLIDLGLHEQEPREAARALLANSLFGDPCAGMVPAAAGQHDPGHAGGANQGNGIEQEAAVNPWDIVFVMEGTILWSTSARRLSSQFNVGAAQPAFSSPFTVRGSAVGYSSSSAADSPDRKPTFEVWAPIWPRPTGYSELSVFLGEGRAELGRQRVGRSIDFARAAASLGTDRGVSEFARYSLLERRGQGYYVALPTGHFPVEQRRESDLLLQLNPILNRVDRFLRAFQGQGQEPPAALGSARRAIDEAIYALLLHGGAVRVKALVAALGRMEKLFAMRDRAKKPQLRQPLSGLSVDWVAASDDGSLEIRIAAALASIGPAGEVGPIRANLAPVDPAKPWRWASGEGQRYWSGNSLAAKIAGVLARRMTDAQRLSCEQNPLGAALPLAPQDVASFLEGALDEGLVEDLLFGFSWVKWSDTDARADVRRVLRRRWAEGLSERVISRPWAMLKLLFLPHALSDESGRKVRVTPEPSLIPLLRAGRVAEACRIAQRRLFTSGFNPVRADFTDNENGPRLAAALLLPAAPVWELTRRVLIRVQQAS